MKQEVCPNEKGIVTGMCVDASMLYRTGGNPRNHQFGWLQTHYKQKNNCFNGV